MTVRAVIPCTPLVKQYLEACYPSPLKLNRKDLECKLMLRCLDGRRRKRYNFVGTEYSEQFILLLDADLRGRVGVQLNQSEVFEINQVIKKLIYRLLFDYLDVEMEMDPEFAIKEGIKRWCTVKEMNPDTLPISSMIKAYYRHRKSKDDGMIKTNWNRSATKNSKAKKARRIKPAA